MKVKYSPVI